MGANKNTKKQQKVRGSRRQRPTSQTKSREPGRGNRKGGQAKKQKKKQELSLAERKQIYCKLAKGREGRGEESGESRAGEGKVGGEERGGDGGTEGGGKPGEGEGQGQGVGRARSCIWQETLQMLPACYLSQAGPKLSCCFFILFSAV